MSDFTAEAESLVEHWYSWTPAGNALTVAARVGLAARLAATMTAAYERGRKEMRAEAAKAARDICERSGGPKPIKEKWWVCTVCGDVHN